MKKGIYYWCPMIIMLLSIASCVLLSACDNDDDKGIRDDDLLYQLDYKNGPEVTEWNNSPYVDWNNSMISSFLTMEFGDGIPKGADWYLECDESWIKLRNHGQIRLTYETIPITIEDNTSYNNREAHIYLSVPEGIPMSSSHTTIKIHQYGYEWYFEHGKEISFVTDRSQAKDNTLIIEVSDMDDVVEIDWGDDSKEVFNEKESYQSLSHQYSNNSQSYQVKLRFGGRLKSSTEVTCSFSFSTERDQGIRRFYDSKGQNIQTFSDSSTKKFIRYRKGEFTFKEGYKTNS